MKNYIVFLNKTGSKIHGKKQTMAKGYDPDDALFRAGIQKGHVAKMMEEYA